MTRQRDIPGVQYRSPNMINMTLSQKEGVSKYRVMGAARLNDAYGSGAGVGGYGTLEMFEVYSTTGFRSPSVQSRRLPGVDESSRGILRMVFDPDDYTTPEDPAGSYLPTDDQTLFLRVQAYSDAMGTYLPAGPILAVPPYDFFTTKNPTFTVSGRAPNLGTGTFPAGVPAYLGPGAMNFTLPAQTGTISLVNLDSTDPIYFCFHPGMPPSVLLRGQDVNIGSSGIPEIFIASPNGNPWFTIRSAVVNSA